jgi:HYR domain
MSKRNLGIILILGTLCLAVKTFVLAQSGQNDPCKIICPSDVTANTDVGKCSASGVSLGDPTATGNCTITSVNDAPTEFPKGVTTVTWTITDDQLNQSTCTQKVTVVDKEKPTIACWADLTKCADSDGTAVVTWVDPKATDNCPEVKVTCSPESDSTFPAGKTTVTCTATDASGNSANCTMDVYVISVKITGKNKVVALCNEPGTIVTLTADVKPPGGTYEWTTTSPNVQFVGSTTGSSVTVQGVSPSSGRNDTPVKLTYTLPLLVTSCDATKNMTVQKPTSVSQKSKTVDSSAAPTTGIDWYVTKFIYQIRDQFGDDVTEDLRASEVTSLACGSQPPAHVLADGQNIHANGGQFSDSLGASSGTTCIYSQYFLVHILPYPGAPNQPIPGCLVGRYCLKYTGADVEATPNTGSGSTQCCQ